MTSDATITIGIRGQTEGGKRIKRTLDDVARSGDKATKSQARLDKQVKKTSRAYSGLATAIKSAAVLAAGLAFIRAADNMTILTARVRNSTESIQEFEFAMTALRKSAEATGTSLNTSVNIFQRLSFVRKEIGASVEEMARFTDNVQKLGVVSGASTQALNAGLTQLGQGLSSGVLRAEEFNSILENIPAVALAIADELGVSTGQLRNMVLEGELLSKDVFAAILNQTKKINADFETFPVKISTAFNAAVIGLQATTGAFADATGASDLLVESITRSGKALETILNLIQMIVLTMKVGFRSAVAEVTGLFLGLARTIEGTINTTIQAFNKIPGVSIEKADFAPDVSTSDLRKQIEQESVQDLQRIAKAGINMVGSAQTVFGKSTNDELKEAERTTRAISKNYGELAENIAPATGETKELANVMREIQKETDRFANKAADGFADFVTGATTAKEALRGLVNDLLSLTIRKGITGPLSDVLGGALGGLFGGGSSNEKSGSSAGGTFASVASSALGSLFGFNSGGSMMLGGTGGVDQNVLSLNGAPIAKTSRGETMSISPRSQGGGGGVVVNQTINVSTGVVDTVRAEMLAILPEFQKSTEASIREANLRGFG